MKAESVVQMAVRQQLKAYGFESVAVPNGSVLAGNPAARARQTNAMKRDGMLPGFADLIVFGSGGRVAFVEVKREGTYQTPSQKACQAWLESLGHLYTVMRSSDDVQETLQKWSWI